MITRRKRYIYETGINAGILKDVVLDKNDYGVSFCDLSSECDIEGHVPEMLGYRSGVEDFMERCKICRLVRDVKVIHQAGSFVARDLIKKWQSEELKYSDWHEMYCPECEENCIVSRPLDNFNCPNCGKFRSFDISSFEGLIHTGKDDKLLFDCNLCDTQDQIIA